MPTKTLYAIAATTAITGSLLAAPTLAAAPPPSVAGTTHVTNLPIDAATPVTTSDRFGNVVVAGRGGTAAGRAGGRFAGVRPDNPHAPGTATDVDAWVAKLNRHGDVLWLRTLAGSQADLPYGVALLGTGDVAVTGSTESPDWPGVPATDPRPLPGVNVAPAAGAKQAFVTVLSGVDGGIRWSRLLGGSGTDTGVSVAAGPSGGVIVAGDTVVPRDGTAAEFSPQRWGAGADSTDVMVGFVTSLSALGATRWTRLIRPSRNLPGYENNALTAYANAISMAGVVVDRAGRVVVAGDTANPWLPTTRGSVQPRPAQGGGWQGFVLSLTPDGKRLVWGSYLGGRGDVRLWGGLALGPSGTVAVAGWTTARNLKRARPAQPACRAVEGGVGYYAEFDATGSRLLRASCWHGTEKNTGITGVSYSADGSLVLVGTQHEREKIQLRRPLPNPAGGPSDGFVSVIDSLGRLRTSTLLGGSKVEDDLDVAALPGGELAVTGVTESPDFPGTPEGDPDAPMRAAPINPMSIFVTRLRNF